MRKRSEWEKDWISWTEADEMNQGVDYKDDVM